MDDPDLNTRGIVAYTPLYEVPAPFSVTWSLPAEEFHLIKEGVGRLMVKRMFEQTNTKEAKRIHSQWSAQFEAARVFSEIPRCTRTIDTGKLKGAELGLIVMGAFPSLVHLLEGRKADYW